MYTILVVDDEKDIVSALDIYLKAEGYRVLTAYNGREALSVAAREDVHLILMDIMMPVMDGLTAMAQLRQTSNVPVILLTAKSEDTDKVLGLNVGADDYITKPFGTVELLARIRTSLRHGNQMKDLTSIQQKPYHCGNLTIDFDRHVVTLHDTIIHLTQIEYKLLTLLAKNSGKVLTYSFLMEKIWGPYVDSNNQILRVNMANIRRKIEENPATPEYVFTEIGVGYRMAEDEN